jgi:hypothetical protein
MKPHSLLRPVGPLLILAAACDTAPPARPPEPAVQTDVKGLQEMIVLPDGFGPPRWVVEPLGKPSLAPGPTDYRLLVYLPVPDPAALDQLGPAGEHRRGRLDPRWARELLPGPLLSLLRQEGENTTIYGRSYPAAPFERMPWHAQEALGLEAERRSVGLLVWLQTM